MSELFVRRHERATTRGTTHDSCVPAGLVPEVGGPQDLKEPFLRLVHAKVELSMFWRK